MLLIVSSPSYTSDIPHFSSTEPRSLVPRIESKKSFARNKFAPISVLVHGDFFPNFCVVFSSA